MIPPLYGLLINGEGASAELTGHHHLRVRLYTHTDSFVALSIAEDGRYQVVEQQGVDRKSHVVRYRRLSSSAPLAAAILAPPTKFLVEVARA
jgi:hypothetical protein